MWIGTTTQCGFYWINEISDPLKLEIDELKLRFYGDNSSFSKPILMATSATCAGSAEAFRVKLEAVLEIVGGFGLEMRGMKCAGK